MKNKSAIIIGVTGQDGSYLSELLLAEGYKVLGVKRRSSTDTTERLAGVMDNARFRLMEGDITDYASMSGVLTWATQHFGSPPDEIYNLAAQSHVGTSFQQPLATWDSTAMGVLNLLEAIRQNGYIDTTRFYQASTSEMFGDNYHSITRRVGPLMIGGGPQKTETIMFQDESVPLNPRSPYAIAKVAAHQAVNLYRDAYGLFGCCGILFNHESPRRGENFVTRKITKWVAEFQQWISKVGASSYKDFSCNAVQYKIYCDMDSFPKLRLGNLDASRDWGHAKDYVRAMHMMLQHDTPDDYVVATGKSHSVRDFCECAFSVFDHMKLDYKDYIYVDPEFIRPAEVPHLQGKTDKIQNVLGWEPQIAFNQLVTDMVTADIAQLKIRNE